MLPAFDELLLNWPDSELSFAFPDTKLPQTIAQLESWGKNKPSYKTLLPLSNTVHPVTDRPQVTLTPTPGAVGLRATHTY